VIFRIFFGSHVSWVRFFSIHALFSRSSSRERKVFMKTTSALLKFWFGIPNNRKPCSRKKRMTLESLDSRITPSVVPVSGNPWGMVTGDFDRDGLVDIVTTGSQFSSSSGSNTGPCCSTARGAPSRSRITRSASTRSP